MSAQLRGLDGGRS